MNAQDYINKVNELNAKFPNLKPELTTGWGGVLQIKVCNSDKARTLKEMYREFNFTF